MKIKHVPGVTITHSGDCFDPRHALIFSPHDMQTQMTKLLITTSSSMVGRFARPLGFATALLACIAVTFSGQASDSPREKLLMDANWKFYPHDDWGTAENLMKAGVSTGPADPTFCDASFRVVNLPHDWVVELPFDSKSDRSHGFKPVGKNYPENSVAWYRRTFTLEKSDDGKRIWLDFDGVYRDCLVFVNGYCMGRHESGYDSFRYDITDVANFGGENVVAVRVDASKFEGWFYEGVGIYRHVWLEKTSPVAIAPDGIFVYPKFQNNTPGDTVEIDIKTQVSNFQTNDAATTVRQEIFSPSGESVAKNEQGLNIGPFSKEEAKSKVTFPTPVLWSPESPKLYKLVTTVDSGGAKVDREETEFAVRTFAFDVDKGFLLNGKPYVIQGTCNHQDHAGVGAALPDALQYFRIATLKEFGCNAYRTSHNAPTPELLEACDRLGMLVMDENRLLGSDPENMALLEGQIRRDRSHASVFIWSICNEECVQASPASARIAETMQRDIHRLDPTRQVTSAVSLGDVYTGIDGVVDVRGWNYHLGQDTDEYHREHPAQPNIGTEQASTTTTRGIYAADAEHGYQAAYDGEPHAGTSAEDWWMFFAQRPWLSGGFAWTGFDYRGEPTPYSWPCINSHFGIVDTCGFPKDNFYYYQAWWTTNPVLHLLPHWNWQGKEGQEIRVDAFSNCKEVELFLNGESLGKKHMTPQSKLTWQVKYEPGTLSAKGYDGKVVAETKVETTGDSAKVRLAPDRASIQADGEDVSAIAVSITDGQNRTVPTANKLVHFELSGPGKIIGVGNGDPSCHEPDVYLTEPALHSGTMNHWWFRSVSGKEEPREVAEKFSDTRWDMVDVSRGAEGVEAGKAVVYRAHLFASESDLALTNVALRFGSLKGDSSIYVNGKLTAESHEAASTPTFNVRKRLHAGVNTIAVLIKADATGGGMSGGVMVEIEQVPVVASWSRSTFNGLAQVLVQSTQEAGKIQLTASADGLAPATLSVETKPCTPRAAVP
jgi:beta-galactosidase